MAWARNLISHAGEEFYNCTLKLTLQTASQPTTADQQLVLFCVCIESVFQTLFDSGD